jgi:arginase family enzyme
MVPLSTCERSEFVMAAICRPIRQRRQRGVQQALDLVPNGARCIITIDCDGLDPGVIQAVIVPQPGGLSYGEVIELLDGIAARARIIGFDLVELVPSLDVRGLGRAHRDSPGLQGDWMRIAGQQLR